MSYYFIGIGGIGMSGLAKILLQRGHKVRGSDVAVSAVTQALVAEGAEFFEGHDPKKVLPSDRVVYGSGIKSDNPEYRIAEERGQPLIHRSVCLHEIMEGSSVLLVAGTHGKTTTSSLLAHVLTKAGKDPSYCIGGIVKNFGSQAGIGKGEIFVAEADESDGSFSVYEPTGAIITNIEEDHMPYWKTKENLIEGFRLFCKKPSRKDLVFFCADDPILRSLSVSGVGYGFSQDADLCITEVSYTGWSSRFSIRFDGAKYEGFEVPLIGAHNVLNAAAVTGLCLRLGLKKEAIAEGLKTFEGVIRRCEKKGEVNGISVYDDYGHHPTEIGVTLQAVKKAAEGRRVVAVFQPHRFTRTRDCFEDFEPALSFADLILVTDVYSAGEEPISGVTSPELVARMNRSGNKTYEYVPREELLQMTGVKAAAGDVIVTIGAGDITKFGPQLLEHLRTCL